jgi:hypothetical protein
MPFPEDGDSIPESSAYDSQPTFDPYDPPEDPESVQPTSPGPAQLSPAPGFGDTSGADGESQEAPQDSGGGEEEEAPEEDLPEFDPKHRQEFEGLLYLGRLQETFRLWGHTFVIKTLTTEEVAEIGLIIKPYRDSAGYNAVYQSATVAACVVTVDGKPLPQTIEIDTKDELRNVRFPYVLRNWMPPVREAVWNRYFNLELTVRRVLDALGEASG